MKPWKKLRTPSYPQHWWVFICHAFNEPMNREMQDISYLRFAFCGEIGEPERGRALDTGIVRTLWMSPQEVRDSQARHRSPLVLQCMEDYLAGQRHPLGLIYTDASVSAPGSRFSTA